MTEGCQTGVTSVAKTVANAETVLTTVSMGGAKSVGEGWEGFSRSDEGGLAGKRNEKLARQ